MLSLCDLCLVHVIWTELHVEIGVECQMFVIVVFLFCSRALQFGAHSRYYDGALITQNRSRSVICTTYISASSQIKK